MKNSILIKVALGCTALVLVMGCKSGKQLRTTDVGAERSVTKAERSAILQGIHERQVNYTTFTGRAKSSIRFNQDSHDVTMNLRIKRDEAIWISVTAVLGIEVARVLITPDSIKLINRLQSTYINKPFSYIYNYTSPELGFTNLQELLTGNVISQVINSRTEVTSFDTGKILRGSTSDLLYLVQVNEDYKAVSTALDEDGRGQRLEALYDNFGDFAGQLFPQRVRLEVLSDRVELTSDMYYNRVAFDQEVDLPFTIPARFKEVQ